MLRGRSERTFGTLQDRLGKELALAGITDIDAANAFIREVYLPAHNARFAVEPAGEGLAFTPIPGVDLDEILCVEEERQVGNDNCVSYRTLKLQIPESLIRPHFVKARVKVHVYPDGSHALFHGAAMHRPLRRERNDQRCEKRRLDSLGGETLWTAWTSLWLAHPAHRRTKAEEADIRWATKTGQLNSLSTAILHFLCDRAPGKSLAQRAFGRSCHSRATPNPTPDR